MGLFCDDSSKWCVIIEKEPVRTKFFGSDEDESFNSDVESDGGSIFDYYDEIIND